MSEESVKMTDYELKKLVRGVDSDGRVVDLLFAALNQALSDNRGSLSAEDVERVGKELERGEFITGYVREKLKERFKRLPKSE